MRPCFEKGNRTQKGVDAMKTGVGVIRSSDAASVSAAQVMGVNAVVTIEVKSIQEITVDDEVFVVPEGCACTCDDDFG